MTPTSGSNGPDPWLVSETVIHWLALRLSMRVFPKTAVRAPKAERFESILEMMLLPNPYFFCRNLARLATHGPQDALRKNVRPPVKGQRLIQSVPGSLKEYAK